MASVDFPLMADEGSDDLPRTLRREREARERAAREREAKARSATLTHDFGASDARRSGRPAEALSGTTVDRFDVPFGHLMMFFIKAVMAAIPALILLAHCSGSAATWSKRSSPSSSTCRFHHLPQLRRTRVPKMASVRVMIMLAASILAAGACAAYAATEEEPEKAGTKKSSDPKDILVPIPSYSKDVDNNGCHVRAGPQEKFAGPDDGLQHVPFRDLISETIGRYSVRAILDAPEKFMASLAPLDADTRTLVMLDVLRDGLGRDGLHTYFFLSSGQHAPAIRDALRRRA